MKEITITKYMAEDGTIFNTRNACERYEKNVQVEWTQFKKTTLTRIKNICATSDCDLCPFYKKESGCIFRNVPDDWELED